ncbi:hypothetical protein E4U42_001393, partial [Claviceps africana]
MSRDQPDRETAPFKADDEEKEEEEEEEPFLHRQHDKSEASTRTTRTTKKHTRSRSVPRPSWHAFLTPHPQNQPRHSRPYTSCQVALFSLLLVLTTLGLAGLLLRATSQATPGHRQGPTGSHPVPASHHDAAADDASHSGDDRPSSSRPPHLEHVPPTPRLRDSSEYVLSPSWDAAAEPATREYRWTITDARLNPDGVYRPMMLINNQFPGPLVECNEGDSIVVRVRNEAANATSVHFHGLFQNGTNFMDGTVGVTQCPIAPGSSFTYRFRVRGQSGTYWYHAHHSAQAADGL